MLCNPCGHQADMPISAVRGTKKTAGSGGNDGLLAPSLIMRVSKSSEAAKPASFSLEPLQVLLHTRFEEWAQANGQHDLDQFQAACAGHNDCTP